MYDIIIVGAGPAGATLARLIGKRYKVLILDRRNLIEPREETYEKCCGGLIAPDAQHMLAKLGLGVPKEVLVGPQLFTVRTIDIKNKFEGFYQRHYINIDRKKFDEWLVSLIPSNVDIRCKCSFKSYQLTDNYIKVKFIHDGKVYIEETNVLVGADGAFSRVREQLSPNLFPKKYVAIQEWFDSEDNLPYFSAIFDEDITDFYSWAIPKEGHLIIGSALLYKDDVSRRFELLKYKLLEYGFKLNRQVKRNGAFILRPERVNQILVGKGQISLIGEAAGWISPTSAEGLSYCFRSAVALSNGLLNDYDNFLDMYYKNTKSLRTNILMKNLKSPVMFNSLLRNTVMKLGIMSMDIYN